MKYLGHNFIKKYQHTSAWRVCIKCKVCAWQNVSGTMQFWPDDIFHKKLNSEREFRLSEFDLSCEEVIIKNILE